ncbi:MAG TPA: MFS transporter [Anaerolineae bacterium]|nr:MFS transporter [Anaerolineae bacterium]HNU05025.1 MFS transporter [Anaerolineae bacterium]
MTTLPATESTAASLKRSQTNAFFVSFIALGFAFSSLGPTLPSLANNTGSTLSQISILFTVQSLGLLAGNFFSGRLFDRRPAFPFLATVVLLTAAMLALIPLMTSLGLLATLLFIMGLATGSIDVGGNTMLVWLHGNQAGPRMNALHFFFGIGALLAPIFVAQAIGLTGGVTWAYWLLALLVLPAAVLFLRLPSPVAPARIAQARRERIPWLPVGLMIAAFFLFVGAEVSFGGWIYTYALSLGLVTVTSGGYLTSVFWGALTLGRLLTIPIAGRVRPRYLLLADVLGGAASLSLLLMMPGVGWALWVAAFGFGLSMANVYPTLVLLGQRHLHMTAAITSLFMVGGSLGSMAIPWLIGQRFEATGPQVTMMVLLAAVIMAGMDVAAFLWVTRGKRG